MNPPFGPAIPERGRGSTSAIPRRDYWTGLAGVASAAQVKELRTLSDRRLTEFAPADLSPPRTTALALLDRVAADGWLSKEQRRRCPRCRSVLDDAEASLAECPYCEETYDRHGGVETETVYTRNLPLSRSVDWVVALHGMNTRGAWQEEFSWHFATTWGRSVPVFVYKYGTLRLGVISPRTRRKLLSELREKLVVHRDQARAHGFSGKPDLIAHSFGTWLLGHLAEHEVVRNPNDRIEFGRLILTGCILPVGFDWKRIKDAGVIEEILNHAATKDRVVSKARFTIPGSGPSGLRGFDGDQVVNLLADGCGHSDLFSIEKCVKEGKCCQRCTAAPGEIRHLDYFYRKYWQPFLTLPGQELRQTFEAD